LVEQGSSSEVGLVPDAICGRGGSVIELDFAQSKAGYLPYAAATPTHSVRPCAQPTFLCKLDEHGGMEHDAC